MLPVRQIPLKANILERHFPSGLRNEILRVSNAKQKCYMEHSKVSMKIVVAPVSVLGLCVKNFQQVVPEA